MKGVWTFQVKRTVEKRRGEGRMAPVNEKDTQTTRSGAKDGGSDPSTYFLDGRPVGEEREGSWKTSWIVIGGRSFYPYSRVSRSPSLALASIGV